MEDVMKKKNWPLVETLEYREIWNLIEVQNLTEALSRMQDTTPEGEYNQNLEKLIYAEIELRQGNFSKSIQLAKEAYPYFSNRNEPLDTFKHEQSDLQIDFLELCLMNWIFTRALTGLNRPQEALTYARFAMQEWELYQRARAPFLHFILTQEWSHFFNEIAKHAYYLREVLGEKLSKNEILDLVVPDGFTPKPFTTRHNNIKSTNPFVSVCIASYRDGPWLKTTIDAILRHAGYENYEIVILLQKDLPNDDSGLFLESPLYAKNPKIKLFHSNVALGSENAKQISYEKSKGELVISLDAHIIPCKDFIGKTVKIFVENPEVSILDYGLVVTEESKKLYWYHFSEIPNYINGIIMIKPLVNPEEGMYYKPGLYIRQTLVGTFCITRTLFEEVGGYLLKEYSWGDKCLGMQAYLLGYPTFYSSEIACIHKWHTESTSLWSSSHRITKRFEYENTVPLGALMVGYFFYSKRFFEELFIPWIRESTGDELFEHHWQEFQRRLPDLTVKKEIFWQKAVRSIREFWLHHWDFVWAKFNEEERQKMTGWFDPDVQR
jgi:GT2 family glycosyltransferase